MSVLSAIKTFIEAYSGLEEDAPVWVNFLRSAPGDYSIVPIEGTRIVSQYIHGRNTGQREYIFALQSSRFTADDIERIGNEEFFEAFADWLDVQTDSGNLPDLDTVNTDKTPIAIEATGFGYLWSQGESETGVYQILCKLEYVQE